MISQSICVNDETFLKCHVVSDTLGQDTPGHFRATYPACTDTRYNMYQMSESRFSSFEESFSHIRSSVAQHKAVIRMQFTTVEEVDRAFHRLINDGMIRDFLYEAGLSCNEYQGFWDYEHQTVVIEFR